MKRKEPTEEELQNMSQGKRWKYTHYDNWVQHRRVMNRQYKKQHPERERYSAWVTRWVKRGRFKRGPCIQCGNTTGQIEACTCFMHQQKPVFFCNACHNTFHDLLRKLKT